MFRNIRQKNTQFGADAEKQIDFSKSVWAMQYGLGGSKNDNGNSDHSYWVRLYDPKYQTSNNQELTMLVESSSKNRFAYWNNTFQFGDSSQYRLNAGVRYDNSSSKAKDNPNHTLAIRGQSPYLGSERKHSGFSYGLGLGLEIYSTFESSGEIQYRLPRADFGRNLAIVPASRLLP